jgi:glycosyltransferase involved in cell wall biosynthesis
MQCGAPVLASATTSVGEIVGEGGLRLPPEDVDAWAAALGNVLRDAALREQLRRNGMERANTFRWEQTAQQTLDVYERVGHAAHSRP